MLTPNIYYGNFWALRNQHNAFFTEKNLKEGYWLEASAGDSKLGLWIDKFNPNDAANLADYEAHKAKYAGRPIFAREKRFITHSFADGDQRTWDSRTTGNIVAWAVGAITTNPLNGLWLTLAGAGALQAWAQSGGEARLLAGQPNEDDIDAFTAMGQNQLNVWSQEFLTQIGKPQLFSPGQPFYDDVKYRWIDSNGQVLVYLDQINTHDGAPTWKDDQHNVIVRYDQTAKRWFRKDAQDAWTIDVTDSTYRLKAYEGFKLQIQGVSLFCHEGVVFDTGANDGTGRLHYGVVGYGDQLSRPAAAPAPGLWKGDDFVYENKAEFEKGTNGAPSPPNAAGYQTLTYDYTATTPNIVDSIELVHVDTYIEGHKAFLETGYADAAFYCVMRDSY